MLQMVVTVGNCVPVTRSSGMDPSPCALHNSAADNVLEWVFRGIQRFDTLLTDGVYPLGNLERHINVRNNRETHATAPITKTGY